MASQRVGADALPMSHLARDPFPVEQPEPPVRRPRFAWPLGCSRSCPAAPRWLPVVVLPALAVLATTACNSVLGIEGSGVPETRGFAVGRFDEIDISNTFDVEITVADGPPSVEVTVDDNLVDHLEVEVDGTTLSIGFQDGRYDPHVTPTAVVSVSELTALEVSGASAASVAGLDAADFELDVSGASLALVEGSMTNLAVAASGASSAVIEGVVANDVELDASGASDVDLSELTADEVAVDLSGASSANVGSVSTIDGVLSGASSLEASSDSDLSVRTSGASIVDWS